MFKNTCTNVTNLTEMRLLNCSIRLERPKMQHFWETYSHELEDDDFRRYYRMEKGTFAALVSYLNPKIRKYQGGRQQVPPAKMVAITLCFLGSTMPYWQLSGIFGLSEECFIRITDYVMELLMQKSGELIKWPAKDDYKSIARHFNRKKKR